MVRIHIKNNFPCANSGTPGVVKVSVMIFVGNFPMLDQRQIHKKKKKKEERTFSKYDTGSPPHVFYHPLQLIVPAFYPPYLPF